MAKDHGIKIVKEGTAIDSVNLRDIILSSKYSMLKYHSTSTGSATINQGDTSKYVDFAHNLGYVPAFLAYTSFSELEGGKEKMIPSFSWNASDPPEDNYLGFSSAYATSTKIRCYYNLARPYNQIEVYGDGVYWELQVDEFGIVLGRPSGFGGKSTGWHFSDVPLVKDTPLTSAQLEVQNVFSVGEENTKYKIYGIDEDNVGNIDGLGKDKTTAFDAREQSPVGGYWNFGTDVKDQVAEIIARGGWSSGNNMGFYLLDDNTPEDSYIGCVMDDIVPILTIVKTGSVTIYFRVIIFKDKLT